MSLSGVGGIIDCFIVNDGSPQAPAPHCKQNNWGGRRSNLTRSPSPALTMLIFPSSEGKICVDIISVCACEKGKAATLYMSEDQPTWTTAAGGRGKGKTMGQVAFRGGCN